MSKNRWLLLELAAPLARRPINEIIPAEILVILKRIEKTGRRETARRLRGATVQCSALRSRACEPPMIRRMLFAERS